jgi:2-polyprenyl-6-methoxyphenol hydroxylase-like FAD-dependent oxidoreductase
MRIAIIGGGIGGLTAALALRQFGFEPQIFEQAPHLLEVGAAILMWPNAMRVVHRLGVADTIREHGAVLEKSRWLRRDGKLLNQFSLPRTDVPAVALHRADLQQALVQALPQESIHLNHVFEAYEQLPDRIVAHFSNGSSFESDVLIGADGLHSRARAQLLNDGPPADRGYIAWRGVVPYTPASVPPATAIEIYGSGQRFGIGPLGPGKVGWWASANKSIQVFAGRNENARNCGHPDTNANGEWQGRLARETRARCACHNQNEPVPNRDIPRHNSNESKDRLATREELLDLFDGWCEPVVELIRATSLTSLVKNTVVDRTPVRKWGAGSLTLLGDAIHPTTPNLGQGGCLAIEDAAVLARCFEKYAPNGTATGTSTAALFALRRYESLRFAHTTRVARYSRLYGIIGQWESGWGVPLRDLFFSLVPNRFGPIFVEPESALQELQALRREDL